MERDELESSPSFVAALVTLVVDGSVPTIGDCAGTAGGSSLGWVEWAVPSGELLLLVADCVVVVVLVAANEANFRRIFLYQSFR